MPISKVPIMDLVTLGQGNTHTIGSICIRSFKVTKTTPATDISAKNFSNLKTALPYFFKYL